MKIVVADTSPINYLVLVGAIDLLPRIYGRILIPTEVFDELSDPGAPPSVAAWLCLRPEWLEVERVTAAADAELAGLDAGERAAILLAERMGDALLLVDDGAARLAASRRGLANTGTLGILRAGSEAGLIDLRTVLSQLAQTNFRISKTLIEKLLGRS